MIISLHQFSGEQTATQTLACHLHKQTKGRASGSALAGEIVLENVSSSAIEIPIRTSPLQHLNLIVTDSRQRIVSTGHYGDLFSPGMEGRVFRLLPGEKYGCNVSLLATVPVDQRRPGVYLIQTVYETDRIRAVSPPFRLDWHPEQDG